MLHALRITVLLALFVILTASQLSTKEKIRIHKEWLEKRAQQKRERHNYANSLNNEISTRKSSYYRKFMKTDNEMNNTGDAAVIGNETLPPQGEENRNIYDKRTNKQKLFELFSERRRFNEIETATISPPVVLPKNSLGLNDRLVKDNETDVINRTSPLTAKTYLTTEATITTSTTSNDEIKSRSFENNTTITTRKTATSGPPTTTIRTTETTEILNVIETGPTSTTQSTEVTVTSKTRKDKLSKKFPRWGLWSKWSHCSRSCGGGIMFQQRKCILKRAANSTRRVVLSRDCVGLFKRYHLCNEQDCPINEDGVIIDFRHQQCSHYDEQIFQDKLYKWEPYVKDDAECELNCKPIGMKYFATLNQTVVDGTACNRPAEYYRKGYRGRAVCVEGICKDENTMLH